MPVVRVAECTGPATHLRADMIPIVYTHTHFHTRTHGLHLLRYDPKLRRATVRAEDSAMRAACASIRSMGRNGGWCCL